MGVKAGEALYYYIIIHITGIILVLHCKIVNLNSAGSIFCAFKIKPLPIVVITAHSMQG